MIRVCLSLLIGLMLVASFGVSAAQSESPNALIQLVNDYRAANGMPPLEVHASLMAAAQGHADWLAANHTYGHTGAGGSSPQDRARAAGYDGIAFENYAAGSIGYVTMAWTVEMWSNSTIHRQTMLSNSVHVGAGVASNESDTYYVLLVGSPAPPVEERNGESGPAREEATPTEVAVVMVPITIAQPREDGSVWHVVRQGQTAWAIAASYGISLDQLLALNYLDRSDVLHEGDEVLIRLGEGQPTPLPPTPPETHVVQEGETVWSVAMQYGLTVDELLGLNGLVRGDVIKPGDTLRLREPDPSATPTLPATFTPFLTLTPPPTATEAAALPSATATAAAAEIAPLVPTETASLAPTLAFPTVTPVPTTPPNPSRVAVQSISNRSEQIAAVAVVGTGVLIGVALLAAWRLGHDQ